MSTLCGIVTFDGTAVERHTVQCMAEAAPHRVGTDGVAVWHGVGAALAHAAPDRQGVRNGQPLVVGDLICVVNARIDNRQELCSHLGIAGGDPNNLMAASLIAAAYRRWGEDCADHLLGDFAFVVWDARRRRLFAARDAMGARTLYYRTEPRRVLVATEAKQILAAPSVPREPNEAALIADIAGLYALPAMTPFRGIEQLPPGHAMTVDSDGQRVWRYWDIDPAHRVRYRDAGEYADHFRALITAAVGDRLRDAGPAGMFLSGGLDAISVAATAGGLLRKTEGSDFRGYSWAFEELRSVDERDVSRTVAAAYGLEVTDVPGDDLWPLRDHPKHGPDLDDPYHWLYQGLIERTLATARDDGVAVMITTDRGDEMVGNWVYDDLGLLLAGRLGSVRNDLQAFTALPHRGTRDYVRARLVQPFLRSIWPPHVLPPLRRAVARSPDAHYSRPPRWVPREAARRVDLAGIMQTFDTEAPIHNHARRQRYASVFHNDSLRIAQLRQRTFARHQLSHADPWGDRRIAEFVCAIPQWRVQRHSRPKQLTQEAMRGVVPEAARRNPSPSRPGELLRRALDEREVSTVHGLLDESRAAAAGWLDAEEVRASYHSYLRGEPQPHDFWHPLCVEMWLRRWWD